MRNRTQIVSNFKRKREETITIAWVSTEKYRTVSHSAILSVHSHIHYSGYIVVSTYTK